MNLCSAFTILLSVGLSFSGLATDNNSSMEKQNQRTPEILVDVDFFDHVTVAKHWYNVEFFGPAEIDELFKNCRDSGVSIVYWRALCQVADYPSNLTYTLADIGTIKSSSDTRRSEGAFSARVGIKKKQAENKLMELLGDISSSVGISKDSSGTGISQLVEADEKQHKYVFSGDFSGDGTSVYLAVLDAKSGELLFKSKSIKTEERFQSLNLEFSKAGAFRAALLSEGTDTLSVFIADNISLKNDGGSEMLKNGNMEIPDMLQPYAWDSSGAAFVFMNGDYRAASPEIKKKYLPNAEGWLKLLDRPYARELYKKTMKSCDTLKEAVKCARKYNIKIYAWTDPIDDGRLVLPPLDMWASRFLEEHPEYRLVNKDGRTRWGMLCFGYPEVRKYKTEIIKELLSYGVDGIALKMHYQHNQVWDGNAYDYKDFLYNDVALEEYWKMKGKPEDGVYDVRLLQAIYGDFFVQWLRELRPLIKDSGKRLCLFQQPSKTLDQPASAWRIDPVQIINEQLIDDLLLEPRSIQSYKDQFSRINLNADYLDACRRNNVKIGYDFYLNGLVEQNKKVSDKGPYMKEQLLYIAEEPVDFVGIYECMYIDKLKLWPYVKMFSEEIRSENFKRKNPQDKFVIPDEMKGHFNAGSYKNGTSAFLVKSNRSEKDIHELIDGDFSDGSIQAIQVPFELQIKFKNPETVDALRIYHGNIMYSMNPSGASGIKAFTVEGFSEGKWFTLASPVSDIPRANGEQNILSYNTLIKFPPAKVSAVRIKITESNDTGRRMNTDIIIPEKDRVVYLREVEVFRSQELQH